MKAFALMRCIILRRSKKVMPKFVKSLLQISNNISENSEFEFVASKIDLVF